MRPSVSRKLLTYFEPHAIENVWSTSLRLTPSALAFSRSMSILNVGLSCRPLARTSARFGSCLARREQLIARLHELVVAEAAAILELEVEARGRSQRADRRRIDRNDDRVLVRREVLRGARQDRLRLEVGARSHATSP